MCTETQTYMYYLNYFAFICKWKSSGCFHFVSVKLNELIGLWLDAVLIIKNTINQIQKNKPKETLVTRPMSIVLVTQDILNYRD